MLNIVRERKRVSYTKSHRLYIKVTLPLHPCRSAYLFFIYKTFRAIHVVQKKKKK